MKTKQKDEVDLNALPPIVTLTAAVRFDCSFERANKLQELLKANPRSFQRNITRDELIQVAKDKGFYVDPTQQTGKKDTKNQVETASTELTPAVLGKAYQALIADLTLAARKAKKEQIDGKAVDPKAAAKVDPKKDAKASKKDTKVEQVQEEKPPEKEYTKNFDQLFLLYDFPISGEETLQSGHNQLVVVVREKITNWGNIDMGLLDQPNNFENELKERMDEFIDEEPQEEQQQQVPVQQRTLSPRSKEFSQQQNEIVTSIKQVRKQVERGDPMRNLYVKDLLLELDMDIEEETIKGFPEVIIEEICQFSLDQQQFQEWIAPKKVQALITKPPELDPFEQEIARIQEEQKRHAEEERIQQEQLLQQEAAANKKGAKKEAKKTEEELLKEQKAAEEKKQLEEARLAQIEAALEKQQKLKEKMHLQFYKRQLSDLDSQKVGPAIMLEVLLDQLQAEKQQLATGQPQIALEDQDDANRVGSILEKLDMIVQQPAPSQLATINSHPEHRQAKIIIDENDDIERRTHGVQLQSEHYVSQRERAVIENMCFPGIDRHLMPEQPEKSENLRKAEKSKILPFIKVDPYEYERRQAILRFEEVLKELEPEQQWFFGDRQYIERHNQNTLTQTLFKALLFDPHVITKYNPSDDNLLLITYYRNPPGRVLRRKWSADWRVLPNLENWINFFKLNEVNLRNEFYYDIDYEQIGNFHERSKIMYPTDNSLILATKYQIGDQDYLRYKIIKEGVVFGIQNDTQSQVPYFWATFDEGIKITVQHTEREPIKVCCNMTLPSGLILRFMPSGDVVQKYAERSHSSSNSKNMLHLYDNAELNHESELVRVITGQGSVVKYMKDGAVVILYANGNISVQTRNDTWVTTNNRGLRKARRLRDGAEWALDPVPCAIKTDPESGSLIYIRDDQTMVIKYTDGSQYTQHKDGTKMMVSASQDSVIVEHEMFCTVKVSLDRVKARTDTVIGHGSTQANVGFENIFERSNDGRVVTTYLGDGGTVESYKEKQELPAYKEYKTNTIQLVYLRDGGVVKIVDDGEVVLISAQERMLLNQRGENRPDGQDIDYWLQLFSVHEERRTGVFTAFIDQGILQTKDEESNFFSISASGEVVAKISVSLQAEARPGTPEIPDGDFIEEENKFLPPPSSWIPPRLFLINNDNTGQEFLNHQQLQNYFRIKDKDPHCTLVIDRPVPGIPNCSSISFLTQIVQQTQSKHIKALIPQTLDIIPKTIVKSEVPLQKVYTYRNLLKFEPFDKEARAQHQQDLERYEVWRKEQAKTQSEFGVIQKSEEEKDAEFNIQLKILENRRNDYQSETYDQARQAQQMKLEQLPPTPQEQTINVQETSKKKYEGGAEVQRAFHDLQMKAQTRAITSKQKDKSQQDLTVKGFIESYFDTPEGIRVSKTFPPEVFNVPSKNKQKIMSEQEYSQYARTITNQNHTLKDDMEIVPQQPQDLQAESNQNQTHAVKALKPIIIKPSVFTQADIDAEVREQKLAEEALQYRQQKRKDHNVYGSQRNNAQMKKVPCLLKTNPKSELNQKYILTDSLTDNRMKISSMATRVYQQAPSINDLRNEGMHQTIIKTLDKKNNLDEMIDKRNLMINAELNDNLRRDLNIIPIAVRMGMLKQGGLYQTKVVVKNEDVLAQRIVIKQPQTKYAKVFMKQMGPISLGLVREIFVSIDAQPDILGKFQDEFQIVSKHQIYTIPIHAQILEPQQYEVMNVEYRKINKKPLQKNYVHEMRFANLNKEDDLVDSQNSDLLPKINYDKNYKIDPFQNTKKDQDQSVEDDQ